MTFDLLTLKVVSESRVTWATSVPILVFHRPLCSRLRPDVRVRQTVGLSSLNAPPIRGIGKKYRRYERLFDIANNFFFVVLSLSRVGEFPACSSLQFLFVCV